MITLMLLGAGLGGCLFWLVWLLVAPGRSPLVELGRFDAHHDSTTRPERVRHPALGSTDPSTWATRAEGRIGSWLSGQLHQRGIGYTLVRQDLALTGRSFESLLGRKVIAAAAGFVLSALALTWLQHTRGLHLPTGAPLAVAMLLAAGLFFAPDLDIRKEARRRRAEFTEDLSIYLELVSLEMAGYAAAETALPQAAIRGGTWSMLLIRDTLLRARLSGEDTWDALAELGRRIGVPELRDLGSLIKNVSDDGAQVRHTLSARAASMRRARLANEEGAAEERNQSMRLAQLLIAFGFMVFVGYPAFVNITF